MDSYVAASRQAMELFEETLSSASFQSAFRRTITHDLIRCAFLITSFLCQRCTFENGTSASASASSLQYLDTAEPSKCLIRRRRDESRHTAGEHSLY